VPLARILRVVANFTAQAIEATLKHRLAGRSSTSADPSQRRAAQWKLLRDEAKIHGGGCNAFCFSRRICLALKNRRPLKPLSQALIARDGTPGRVPRPFLLRSDNGLFFTSRSYTALARSYGRRQKFITPHSPEQNGIVERLIGACRSPHRQLDQLLQPPAPYKRWT
jgi:hypothetical protein